MLLPQRVLDKLRSTDDNNNIPHIEEYKVYEKNKEMILPNFSVPGDFPPKIWKEYSIELALPVSMILNRIIKTGQWPTQWKKEWVTLIEKKQKSSDVR